MRKCASHLNIDPNSNTESGQGLSKVEAEEGEPIFARPIKTPSLVKNQFADSFAEGWGYHQKQNVQCRGEALPDPPTDHPELSSTNPSTDSQVVQRYGRLLGSSSGTLPKTPAHAKISCLTLGSTVYASVL